MVVYFYYSHIRKYGYFKFESTNSIKVDITVNALLTNYMHGNVIIIIKYPA